MDINLVAQTEAPVLLEEVTTQAEADHLEILEVMVDLHVVHEVTQTILATDRLEVILQIEIQDQLVATLLLDLRDLQEAILLQEDSLTAEAHLVEVQVEEVLEVEDKTPNYTYTV